MACYQPEFFRWGNESRGCPRLASFNPMGGVENQGIVSHRRPPAMRTECEQALRMKRNNSRLAEVEVDSPCHPLLQSVQSSGAHALMENRNDLCADFTLHNQLPRANRWWCCNRPRPISSALVSLPTCVAASVREHGQPAAKSLGVRFLREQDNRAVFECPAGHYTFAADSPLRSVSRNISAYK